ncbi:NLI interacting factor-like phosphatase-domain-containing protein [Halteromyces radiatus]|uniref:NLI interacting factor-like phosphatase-domain-containing protein n=1 Tax=Halteromyces radiatus TaxID=101107 RepID=UPI00221FA509|nr:NLI interacting factor-like phosphatase-domain-containing protein [Halteromyces radiatus]KAI8076736.1 NLI interacting factor-like phosphatase-domain-containing protein [Halteromyces radiatus]
MIPFFHLFTNFMPTLTATLTTNASNTSNTTIPSIKPRKRKLVISFVYHYLSLVYEFVYTFFIIKPKQHLLYKKQKTKTKLNQTTNTRNNNALQYYKGKTLVLDLDETLVHSVRLGSQEANYNVSPCIKRKQIEVQNEKQSLLYQVYKRPHVDFFLKTISQWYKVVIFTASMSEYADPVIDWLDQDQTMVSHRYFRQSCISREDGNYLKNITMAEPDLSKVCLVDNSPVAYDLFKDNGIPITSWLNSPNDESLLDLLPLLDALRFTSDVRSILRLQQFGL